MHSLIEVVFEDIDISKIDKIIYSLTGDFSKVKVIVDSDDLFPGKSLLDILENFKNDCIPHINFAFRFYVEDLFMEDLHLQSVLFRLIRYGELFDLDFTFKDASICDDHAFFMKLQKQCVRVTQCFDIQSCFCGLEPAADVETRFFTGLASGPIFRDIV